MGIRFHCPNGHKMNVKEFQAGKTGICPVCGMKMKIPLESTRPSSRKAADPIDAASERPAAVVESPSIQETPPPSDQSDSSAAMVFSDAPEPDPLAAAEEVVWYVQPPTGDRWGPAATDALRRRLAEGLVAADHLVWREGWGAWREAGEVFPRLAAGLPIPGIETTLPEPVETLVHGLVPESRVPPPKIQRLVFGILSLVVLLLFVIFLVIWMQS